MSLSWAGGAYGEGSFPGVLSPWGFVQYHVVDINSDGFEDIIAFEGVYPPTPDAPYPIHFLISDGAGGYTDQTAAIVPGGLPSSVFVSNVETADFNDDGLPDLFISDYGYDGDIQPGGDNILLLSNPDGTLSDASAGLNEPGLVGYAVIGDIDGDGDLDIYDAAIGPVNGNTVLGPALYVNDGDENFTNVSGQLPAWITDQTDLGGFDYITNNFYVAELHDLNGDGAAELILGQGPRQGPLDDAHRNNGPVPAEAVIFWNDGTGGFSNNSFTALASPVWGRDADYSDIEIADFNGDGAIDILTVSADGTNFRGFAFTLQTGDGNGNFTDVTASAFPLGFSGATPTLGSLEIVDIELDGDLDIVALNQNSDDGSEAPLVWINNGSGVFTETVYWSSILDRGYPSVVVLAPDGTGYNFVWGLHDPDSQIGSYSTFQTQFDLTVARTLQGTDDFDQIIGGRNSETIHGLDGKDSLFGQGGADTLNGDGGNDMLYGGLGADILNGGTGTDFARYDTASAAVTVHLANDQANTGEAFGDTFTDIEGLYLTLLHNDVGFGDGNNNTLYGLGGNDTLNGGGGNDMLFGGTGADTLNGGTGTDYARYDDATSAVAVYLANDRPNSGEAAGDTFTDIEGLYLSAHNDYGFGDDNPNTIYGLGGSDSLAGGLGADYLDGGEGFDYVRYDDAAYPDDIRVYLQSQYSNLNTGVAAIGDIFVSIEGLQTSVRNDTLFGNSENNILLGNLGTDNLYGFTGNDTLYGGAGDPNGDGVRDNFVFDQAPIAANADIVGDFERGLDQIALSTDIFGTDESRIQLNPNTYELVYTGVNGNEYNVIATLIGETVFDASDYYFY
ncbi:FG-GAP-like repeat-containing protein [Hoeflea sp.]|uniref:FG-GAP-like repeat-containing protein n=1 Tax=Hoeflea sp. TaxID=1940281 RepID=UPI003BAF474B